MQLLSPAERARTLTVELQPQIPACELEQRVQTLQDALTQKEIAAALIVESADLYYLSGTIQDAHLLVPAAGAPLLLVRRSLSRAASESPLSEIRPLRSLRDLRTAIESAGLLGERIGFELDVLPAARLDRYHELLAPCVCTDCSDLLRQVRARKSPWEIERIAASGRLLDETFAQLPELAAEGMSEIELQATLERQLRLAGHDGYVRSRGLNQELHYGFVLGGATAAVPGGADAAIIGPGLNAAVGKGSSRNALRRGDPIIVDMVGARAGYLADETRTFALGELDDRWHEAHAVTVAILNAIADAAKPGVAASSLYEQALNMATEQEGFMGVDPVSFIGHGLGLQINEPPFLARGQDQVLEVGHVFALEPKFVLAGRGAVGIENTFVVEAGGARALTMAPPTITVI